MQISVRLAPVQECFGSSTRLIGVASKVLRFRVRYQFSQSRCLSLILATSSRVYLLFPPRGHGPPPTLRDRFNLHLCLQCHRFPIPRYAKRLGITLYAIGPLFLLPTLPSPHCIFKVSEHDLFFWQMPAAHSNEHPRPQAAFREQRHLNARTSWGRVHVLHPYSRAPTA